MRRAIVSLAFTALFFALPASAQVLTSSNVQIDWKVENRFRLFAEAEDFKKHESAWRQYLSHVESLNKPDKEEADFIATTSVLGTEHVLNDRFIPFTKIKRRNYDPKGWAAAQIDKLCYDSKSRKHAACESAENYLLPKTHRIIAWLKPIKKDLLFAEYNCQWRVNDGEIETAPCDEPVALNLPYPDGGAITVAAEGEQPISIDVKVKDLLIIGMGDSFASGEGNPDVPVQLSPTGRHRNVYPKRAQNDVGGNARWIDELCHRSLYGHQLRAALQIGIENPKAAVTFLGYSCSGAAIDEGILGPQTHMDYISRPKDNGGDGSARPIKGGARDNQFYWLMRELCREKIERSDGAWACPGDAFYRQADFILLSIGGNDIGFSNLVTWATLRDSTSSKFAKWFGTSLSPKSFAKNMQDDLPGAYAKLAKIIERTIPLSSDGQAFDGSRVVLTAYPDILEDEKGGVCTAGEEQRDEDLHPANQSLDFFQSWLVVTSRRLESAHAQLSTLHKRMGELAEDHGWTFAGRAYESRAFRGHGFCAQDKARLNDPSEQLMMPCWGKADRATQTCKLNLSGKERDWRPYNPAESFFPYALRQRWVRTFNDAYLVINQKAITPSGQIDERASDAVFAETTGAMHPTAEGHAAMADAILLEIRRKLQEVTDVTENE